MSRKPPRLELALDILELLKDRELSREELAIHFDVDKATIYSAISPLVSRGFVRERKSCDGHDDRRWRWHYATKAWRGFA